MDVQPDFAVLAQLRVAKTMPREGVPLPTPGDVLYAHPNPDGTMKACGNCMFWDKLGACSLVDGRLEFSYVCGYHVHGQPRGEMPGMTAEERISQDLAGVALTPTSCGTCQYFDPGLSVCNAVRQSDDSLRLAQVERMGCCARWTGR